MRRKFFWFGVFALICLSAGVVFRSGRAPVPTAQRQRAQERPVPSAAAQNAPANPAASAKPLSSDPGVNSSELIAEIGPVVPWTSRTPAARSAHSVRLNPVALDRLPTLVKGDRLSLDLPEAGVFSGKISTSARWADSTTVITVVLDGGRRGRIFASVTEGIAQFTVRDDTLDTMYQVRFEPARGEYVAIEIDRETSEVVNCTAEKLGRQSRPASATPGAAGVDSNSVPAAEAVSDTSEPVVLKVLAVYTAAARSNEGGTAGVLNNITTSIQNGNDVLANSETQVQLELIHTVEVDYAETDPSSDLDAITDGTIAEVAARRDEYEADFVVFYVKTNATGGLGWVPANYGRDDLAFSLVRIQQTDFTETVIHELGHNMGNGHSASQATQTGPGQVRPYAAGWQWSDATSPASVGYCSVMTYENFDNVSGDEYRRAPYFSNPEVRFKGNSTGDASAGNAARVIRAGRFAYSGYRGVAAIPAAFDRYPAADSFEDYLVHWYQAGDDDTDWTADATGSTPSSNTGPTAAYDGNYYVFIEASGHPNQMAMLRADLDLRNHVSASISFACHLYGSAMGTLALDVSSDNGLSWTSLWSRSGNQGNAWIPVSVSLADYDGELIRVRFRGVVGSSFASDLALDAIALTAEAISGTAQALPEITAMSATTGRVGDTLTLTGRNLAEVTAVDFGGVVATFQIVSDSEISALVPEGALSGAVNVTNGAGSVSAGSFTVADYANWVAENYPDLIEAGSSEDADHDGAANLLEYAWGTMLDDSSSKPSPNLETTAPDTLSFTFHRGQAGLRYVVEYSTTLDWSDSTIAWDSSAVPSDLAEVGQDQTVEVDISGKTACFVRLRVEE